MARRRLQKKLSLWYHPAYEVPELARTGRTRGIIPYRGKSILSHLVHQKLIRSGDIHAPKEVSIRDLRLVHSADYVESTTQPETLAHIFGLEKEHIQVDPMLRAQRLAVGGTLAATGEVLKKKYPVAFNLGGGFHHAEPDRGSGFCVFNDVAVTIAKIRKNGFHQPIAIIDLDYHQGNGNNHAFIDDATVIPYSIEGSTWAPDPKEHRFHFKLPEHTNDETYLDLLTETLPKFLDKYQPGLIFYIAGNDVLTQDPLGEFDLSVEGVLERDQFVVKSAQDRGIPLVITLAGGYSRSACLCSLNLILFLIGYQKEIICDSEEELHHHFSKISKSLDPSELQVEDWDNLNISAEDISDSLHGNQSHHKILDYYSAHGVEVALERFGFLPRLRELGYDSLKVEVNPTDPSRQLVRVEGKPKEHTHENYSLLAEVVLRKELLPFPQKGPEEKPLELLTVEWLLLQDPQKKFTPQNPQFPGQKFPGLGVAEEAHELLIQMGKRIKGDGILFRPSYFHIAFGSDSLHHFLDPLVEGRYQAMKEVLQDFNLSTASQLVHDEKLVLENGEKVSWIAGNQICPMSERLQDYFSGREYAEAVLEEKHRLLQSGLCVEAMAL